MLSENCDVSFVLFILLPKVFTYLSDFQFAKMTVLSISLLLLIINAKGKASLTEPRERASII